MLRERNQTFKLAFISVDLVLALLAGMSASLLHFQLLTPENRALFVPDVHGPLAPGALFGEEYALFGTYFSLAVFMAMTQVIVFVATDIYHPRRGLSFLREFAALVRGVGFNIIIILAILFFYRGTSFSRKVIAYTAMFAVCYHGLGHFFFRLMLERLRARGYNIRRVLILGTGSFACNFVDVLRNHSIYGYRVVGMVGPGAKVAAEYKDLVAGTMRDYQKIARETRADLIVYAMPADRKKLSDVIDFCDSEGLDCRFSPDWIGMITRTARVEAIDGIPIFTIRDIPLKNGYYRFVKRVFDIFFSSSVLVISAPIMLLAALAVKLDSPGPVFFSQERVGLDRKLFRIYKFRSMRLQAASESDQRWGNKSDDRVTWIGHLLRKTSLDELPQFFNVLMGDMSVVGPRPERPHFVDQFKTRYIHYMRRHAVKAGITGWAQVQGLRGDTSIQKRVEADIFYIENWSFWLDVIICLRTIPSMIKARGE